LALHGLASQLRVLGQGIERLERKILEWHRADATSRRLATIPGIGPITASAIAATVPNVSLFRSGRQFAAWLGLTPRAHSSGGRERQAGISKQGDGYIRRLLVVGATAVLRMARKSAVGSSWVLQLRERKRPKVVAVALANKTARIAPPAPLAAAALQTDRPLRGRWAVMARGEIYAARAA
jgi:transposase